MTALALAAIAARLLQFGSAAVIGGGALFFIYGVTPSPDRRWPSGLIAVAAGLGVLGALGWLMAETAAFADSAAAAFDRTQLWSVARETDFGRAVLLRAGLFFLVLVMSPARPRGAHYWRALAVIGAVATASFAWTGHGIRDEGLAGALHLAADVLHLLAASAWIGALAALVALTAIARRGVERGAGREAVTGLVRFSGLGAAVVAVLVLSGLANSWFLIGPAGLPRLLTSHYGQLLVAKLALFAAMLVLAAVNRFRHTPRLQRTLQGSVALGAVFRPVLISVAAETALAVAVLALVSWLGTLSPPVDG
jgi:putative copper resistance protein D